MEETEEFIELQKELLRHKFLYNVLHTSEITDHDYDALCRKSFDLARSLGFTARPYLGPKENEAHHVHWMIGYNENSIYHEG